MKSTIELDIIAKIIFVFIVMLLKKLIKVLENLETSMIQHHFQDGVQIINTIYCHMSLCIHLGIILEINQIRGMI